MKKIVLILILFLGSILFLGPIRFCYSETVDVSKSMVIPFQEKCLSDLTYVIDDTAHMKIYSSLNLLDELKIYDDLQLLDNMTDIKKLKVFMNSPGGGAYTGFAIADQLKRVAGRFEVSIYASGVIASAAVMVFIAVENRFASADTFFMVHEVASEPSGTMSASDVKRMNVLFDMLTARYIKNLVNATNKTEEEWSEMMKAETWFSAQEAYDWGLVKAVQ